MFEPGFKSLENLCCMLSLENLKIRFRDDIYFVIRLNSLEAVYYYSAVRVKLSLCLKNFEAGSVTMVDIRY